MDDLVDRFMDFARAFRTAAPVYSRIASHVADHPKVLGLMESAEPTQRIPVLLFASVHYLLLKEPADALAHHYPNVSRSSSTADGVDSNVEEAFVRFALEHADELTELMATRRTQTNEIGRCSWLLFPFVVLESEVGALARVDVGSSAGLTLLFPRIAYAVQSDHVIGDTTSITIPFDVGGQPPRAERVPDVAWSAGFDSNPIDVFDDEQIRWLEACVWPEQVERFDRLVAAVDLARSTGTRVERGDAVDDIESFVSRARSNGHPVVTTSWVLNYLTSEQRVAFVERLDRIGSEGDLSWVIAESPRETPELPVHGSSSDDITVISLVTWRGGRRTSIRLATAHPHGRWVNWTASPRVPS